MMHLALLAQAAQPSPTAQTAQAVANAAQDTLRYNQANWLVLFLFFNMVIGLSVTMMLVPFLTAPSRPNPVKSAPYESGMPPIGSAQQRYTVRYYVIAMLFVVFDIEAVFFYPWAAALNAIGWYGFVEMFLFIVLLLVAYVYAWRKGALDWVS